MNYRFLQKINDCLQKKESVLLTGLAGTARTFLINEIFKEKKHKILCLLPSEEKAYDLARELQSFVSRDKIFLFLGRDYFFLKQNSSPVETARIMALEECLLYPRRQAFIIASPASFIFPILSPRKMKELTLKLRVGEEKALEDIIRQVVDSGYQRVHTISGPGQCAVRGGIVDIYSMSAKQPWRMEFFGDYIESIHRFDIDSQRTGIKETAVTISPADELSGKELDSTLLDYFPAEMHVFFDETRDFFRSFEKSSRRYREALKEAHREEKTIREISLLDPGELREKLHSLTAVYHSFFPASIPQVQVGMMENISQKEMEPFFNNYEGLFPRLQDWLKKNYTVQLAVKSKAAREQIKKDLLDHHITNVELIDRKIEKGFSSQTLSLAIVSQEDIWGKKAAKRLKQRRRREEKLLLEDLQQGDYVVHEAYGIGIFRGVSQVETNGITREYILLQYAGTDRLYLPLDKVDLLYKYISSGEKEPRLSKLGGSEWERKKKKAAESVQEMAEELLTLYAARETREGYGFLADTPWQRQFEDDFPYQETPDQLKAINDVKKDMENSRPMDRLICGDVGYGKTEVAMRAAFKAVMDGKQVAILVPTTVLAEQHYQTFKERFEEYPAIIETLSRFRSAREQKQIVSDLGKGVTDIIIGTHRLLSRDVRFKDLGLLIIDEEHRFGVAQKEKIKAIKEMVDVISLSATPIPRSLHMALSGLRDLSVIETPPPERYPITTYVLEYNEEVIKEAVEAEIERQGQVFFVHNRIEDIYIVKDKLEELLPQLSICIGHGRMKENELARIMMDFVQGKYQLLLCTTIIESGLDMPNVNTIIIDGADKMGLAQLYQLRGRVGRSNRIAYAYLTFRPDKLITEDGQKRLNAIQQFNELGVGMKIALRDLEIRGAGNILGAEQHGHIQALGFDLYCRLLEQETARLKGTVPREKHDVQMDIDVDYYIPDQYIPDSGSKMRIYRRLLLAANQDELQEIREEMLDRFGKLPRPVENFLRIASLRILARAKEIKSLRRKGRQIEIEMNKNSSVDFNTSGREFNVRKVNNKTLLLLKEDTSLEGLKGILEMI